MVLENNFLIIEETTLPKAPAPQRPNPLDQLGVPLYGAASSVSSTSSAAATRAAGTPREAVTR
jgi:hypothetical protein